MTNKITSAGVILVFVLAALGACGGGGGGGETAGDTSTPSTTTTTAATAPSAPTGLVATSGAPSVIDLSWVDTSSNETGFLIERSADNTTFTVIGTAAANATIYSDAAGLADATTYYYRARALSSDGNSAYSNTAHATTSALTGVYRFELAYSPTGTVLPAPATALFAKATAAPEKLDIGLIVDTTGSMSGTIAGLKSTLSASAIPQLKAIIPDLAIGVAGHQDFPYLSYGASTDLPFFIANEPYGYVTTDMTYPQYAVNTLSASGGLDGPESQVQAMYEAVTGSGLAWPGALTSDMPASQGHFGALRFRSDAHTFLVSLSDIDFHNGKRALDKTGTAYDTALQNAYSFSTYDMDQLVARLNTIGAKFIGGAADFGARSLLAGAPYGNMAYVADKTASYVPPSAFVSSATCTAGSCCTGLDGAGVAPDGPFVDGVQQCRMVFSYSGSALADNLVTAVVAQWKSLPKPDVFVQLYNDPAETIDVVTSFVQKVEPVPAGGTDPVTGAVCSSFSSMQLRDNFNDPKAIAYVTDGIWDTISEVGGPMGLTYCFNVTLNPNTTVPQTAATKTFKAWMRLVAIKPGGATQIIGADVPIYFTVPALAH